MADFAVPLDLPELVLGGGLGVAYIDGEEAPTIATWGNVLLDACQALGVRSKVSVEPGRAIAAAAAMTVYSVGTIKHIPGVRTYISVDGGMSDNPRPVLYGSGYESFLPRAVTDERAMTARLVGKHCESGDVLSFAAQLPADTAVGDLLAMPVTGAYGHSMGSNYNKITRPPVVFAANGDARLVVRRETYDDLLTRGHRLKHPSTPFPNNWSQHDGDGSAPSSTCSSRSKQRRRSARGGTGKNGPQVGTSCSAVRARASCECSLSLGSDVDSGGIMWPCRSEARSSEGKELGNSTLITSRCCRHCKTAIRSVWRWSDASVIGGTVTASARCGDVLCSVQQRTLIGSLAASSLRPVTSDSNVFQDRGARLRQRGRGPRRPRRHPARQRVRAHEALTSK